MGTILISINPQHVEKILTGLKKCEYRTRKPNRDVNTMIIYETSPTKRVVAECILDEVLTLPKEELWNNICTTIIYLFRLKNVIMQMELIS